MGDRLYEAASSAHDVLYHSHQRCVCISHRRRALLTRNGVTSEMLLNLIFYIVITPVIGTTLTKIMFMSEDSMIVSDAISRIDRVLGKRPLQKRPSGGAVRVFRCSGTCQLQL